MNQYIVYTWETYGRILIDRVAESTREYVTEGQGELILGSWLRNVGKRRKDQYTAFMDLKKRV